MERVITLQIPEETYFLLEKKAQAQGTEPAQVILEWVNKLVQPESAYPLLQVAKPANNLRALFGTLTCEVSGVAENHFESTTG